MSEFALKTALPQYLVKEQEKIEKIAAGEGLDFFPTVFEILTYDQMNEIAAYGGFPNRFPHWRYGMEYERLAKSYEYGLSKIYEMVINNNPSYAYLLEGNSLVDQKMVMAHVYGHVDFFKNNFAFRSTDLDTGGRTTDPATRPKNYDPNRRWIDKMANHGARVRRHVARLGINKVEDFIDQCLSLENLIDPHAPFHGRRVARDPDAEEQATEIPRLKSKDYMESFINPVEYLEEQRLKIEAEKEREKKFPAHPERDILKFLLENAPLERWERDVLEIIREEAIYFVPQMQTKVMNEGWACIVSKSLVFSGSGLVPMDLLVAGVSQLVSDGDGLRHVYDRHVIKDHPTIKMQTRRGLGVEGSVTHRVLLADGSTWKRLDELSVGDKVAVSGGAGQWPTELMPCTFKPQHRISLQEMATAVGTSAERVVRYQAGLTTTQATIVEKVITRWEAQAEILHLLPHKRRVECRFPELVTEELASFVGYLVGDGHISRVKRVVGLTTGDEAQAIAFKELGSSLFGLSARLKLDGNRFRVLFHSEGLADFLTVKLGLTHGPSAREKQIPDLVRRSPAHVVRAFLRAYYDCDGHAGKSGVILVTSSDALAEQTQLLLLNFGILSRKRRAKDDCWRLQIQGKSAQAFSEKIGFGLVRKQRALQEYIDAHKWFLDEKWEDEVVSLEPGRADVYDISVEGTHRYAAAGFIHHNSYWHSKLLTTKSILDASEIIDYAENNAGVMGTSGGRLNPYKLGVELYRNVEERWNKGQFGKEWEECDDLDAKRHWNLRLGLGKKKIFEVRALYNDVTFIDEFLTPDFCREQKLFSFNYSNRNERFEIESREFKQVKEKLLFQLTNAGNPFLYVEDANHDNRGELLIRHDHQGLDLKADYARECMKSLVRVWKRPVNLLTIVEGKQVMVRFDGREHGTRHMRP